MTETRALAYPRSRLSLKGRYVGALVVVALLLISGQYLVQLALDRQEDDARMINVAGRQRMLSQRLCMWLLAIEVDAPAQVSVDRAELARVADEWERSRDALQLPLGDDQRAMLAAAHAAIAGAPGQAAVARAHQDAYLASMDATVASYEREARDRVVALRRTELALLAILLLVLGFEGWFVLRPAVRAVDERDHAQRALLEVADRTERELAQDLHDGLSQQLVGISFMLAVPEPKLDDIRALLGESLDQTRGLVRRLYSHTLEVDGLVPALRELAAQTERVFGVNCRVDGERELAMPVRGEVYRIVREAVLNAAKHARAKSIEIRVGETIEVSDDGAGISGAPGMGLRMMASRARMIGAVVEVTGSPRGTTVTCRLPS